MAVIDSREPALELKHCYFVACRQLHKSLLTRIVRIQLRLIIAVPEYAQHRDSAFVCKVGCTCERLGSRPVAAVDYQFNGMADKQVKSLSHGGLTIMRIRYNADFHTQVSACYGLNTARKQSSSLFLNMSYAL